MSKIDQNIEQACNVNVEHSPKCQDITSSKFMMTHGEQYCEHKI